MSAPATTSQKTPVHSAVAVICDILTPLSNDERMRAMEAIAASLGILNPAARATAGGHAVQPTTPLPLVAINMASPPINGTALVPVRPVGLATPRSYRGANGSSVSIGALPGTPRAVVQGDVNRVVVGGASRSPSGPTVPVLGNSYRCR
jgi:hypothetical protein